MKKRNTSLELYQFLKQTSQKARSNKVSILPKKICESLKISNGLSKCLRVLEKNELIEILSIPKKGVKESAYLLNIKEDLTKRHHLEPIELKIIHSLTIDLSNSTSANALSKRLKLSYEEILKALDSLETKKLLMQWVVKDKYYYKVCYLNELGKKVASHVKCFYQTELKNLALKGA
ncbi:hypothetical protein [Helicobacter cetorum]|uniref:hypothetical protein n=1 Tax=Helicobacter cetorum TaxID=138563 RepID=UPI000CF0C70E|nr:hypothetical protein [Helicobacter cetorum]